MDSFRDQLNISKMIQKLDTKTISAVSEFVNLTKLVGFLKHKNYISLSNTKGFENLISESWYGFGPSNDYPDLLFVDNHQFDVLLKFYSYVIGTNVKIKNGFHWGGAEGLASDIMDKLEDIVYKNMSYTEIQSVAAELGFVLVSDGAAIAMHLLKNEVVVVLKNDNMNSFYLLHELFESVVKKQNFGKLTKQLEQLFDISNEKLKNIQVPPHAAFFGRVADRPNHMIILYFYGLLVQFSGMTLDKNSTKKVDYVGILKKQVNPIVCTKLHKDIYSFISTKIPNQKFGKIMKEYVLIIYDKVQKDIKDKQLLKSLNKLFPL